MTTATLVAMGYRATREGNALIVHDVPIFCNCKRGEFDANIAWVEEAVQNALMREREGYLPPLHIRHHERDAEVRAAGVFKITHAAPTILEGARRLAVFADLIVTDEWAQEEVLKMKYPYRSVEIPVGRTEIKSLALLDHEAPFLKLPMLAITDVAEAGEPVGAVGEPSGVVGFNNVADATLCDGGLLDTRRDESPVVAFRLQGSNAHLLYLDEEQTMADQTPKPKESKVTQKNFEEDKGGEDKGDDEKMEGTPLDVSSIVKAIESGDISVNDMDAITAAIQSRTQGATPEERPEDVPAPAAAPGGEAMNDSSDTHNFAAMQGEIDALKANDAARKATDTRTVDVAGAMKRLEGRVLGSDVEQRLIKFHETHGGEAFKDYVEAFAQTSGILPDDRSVTLDFPQGVPDEAMKFSDSGTDAVDKAAQFCREWDQLRGHGMRASKESYVQSNMSRIGIELKAG